MIDEQGNSTIKVTKDANNITTVDDDQGLHGMLGSRAIHAGETIHLFPDRDSDTGFTFSVEQLGTVRDVLSRLHSEIGTVST